MEPGVMPPMSAWCPLLATKNTGLLTPFLNTWEEKGNRQRSKVKKPSGENEALSYEERRETSVGGTDRRDDCEVGKVAAPGTRVVAQNHIAFFQLGPQ